MCQLFAVSSAAALRTSLSWEGFAMRGSAALGNPDGWGLAYADGDDVHLVREPNPAADSPFVAFLGCYGPPSTTLVSHIRRATKGDRILANTQPFVRRLGGNAHVFAHNGHVAPLPESTSPWLRAVGTTDSEKMFCILLDRLEPLWRASEHPALELRTDVIERFAEEMRSRGAANFLYYDGLTLFAHGHRRTLVGDETSEDPGLFLLLRESGLSDVGPCHAVESIGPPSAQALLATVPLDDQHWRPLAAGKLLRIEHGILV